MIDNQRLISVPELARYLSIGRCKAYDLCKLPDFPSIKIGQKILVDTEKLELWLQNKSQTALKGVKQ